MHREHFAIDGSVVSLEAEADLSAPVTTTGWAVVPSLFQSHPFTGHRQGYAEMFEKTVREAAPEVEIEDIDTFSLKDGELRVAVASMPTATGGRRHLTVAAWEGGGGSLSTSLVGREVKRAVEVFDTLTFHPREDGVVIDAPVLPQPRLPEVALRIPDLGVVAIRPAVASELEQFPRETGHRTRHGELFRFRAGAPSLAFVGKTAVARIDARSDAETDRLMELGESIRVEWTPRGLP